jgi:hypothetical protein
VRHPWSATQLHSRPIISGASVGAARRCSVLNGRLRSVVELIRSGGLGTVKEVACWSAKTGVMFSPGDRPRETAPVPEHLHWDLWLGPAPERPFHPTAYHPRNWRGWWDFGVGNFGDMACYILELLKVGGRTARFAFSHPFAAVNRSLRMGV